MPCSPSASDIAVGRDPSGAERGSKPAEPGLHIVATPIGNARDITLRALDVLASADLIACEDTRVTGRLLRMHGLAGSLVAYHDHNGPRVRPRIVAAIRSGKTVALVSDAGMPLISDPGFALVEAVREAGFRVTSVPGANAALTALQLSGLAPDRFSFLGFLPVAGAARRRVLESWGAVPGSLVVYESGHRLAASLADMAGVLGDRRATVARELTKLHEQIVSGTLRELAERYAETGPPRGEIVVVVGPGSKELREIPDDLLAERVAELGLARAARELSAASGRPRRELYRRGLTLSGRADVRG